MPGLEKILRGILRYQHGSKQTILKQLENFKTNPESLGLLFGCMDCRVMPSKITDTKSGEMFIIRNPGNMVPHYRHFKGLDAVTGEPGALELACVKLNIRNVLVCGHADCRAMAALHGLEGKCFHNEGSILEIWLKKHGHETLEKYSQFTKDIKAPLKFEGASPEQEIEAFIDPENVLSDDDRLSQVNCLQQLTNIASYPFMKERLLTNKANLQAMWLDLNSGDVHMFSRAAKRFLLIDEQNLDQLAKEGENLPK